MLPPVEFRQNDYWIARHEKLAGQARSVGNMGQSEEDNLRGDRALVSAVKVILRQTGARSILDLGCGYGRICAAFGDDPYDYLGIDVAPAAIATARSLFPRYTFERADLYDWSPTRSFHMVFLFYTLSNFVSEDHWTAILGKACAAIEPGGLLLIADHMPGERKAPASHVVFRTARETQAALATFGYSWTDSQRKRITQKLDGSLASDIRIATQSTSSLEPAARDHQTLLPSIVAHQPAPRSLGSSPLWTLSLNQSTRELLVQTRTLLADGPYSLRLDDATTVSLAFNQADHDDGSRAIVDLSLEGIVSYFSRPTTVEAREYFVCDKHGATVARLPVAMTLVQPAGTIDSFSSSVIRCWKMCEPDAVPDDMYLYVNDIFYARFQPNKTKSIAEQHYTGIEVRFEIRPPSDPTRQDAFLSVYSGDSPFPFVCGTHSFESVPERTSPLLKWSPSIAYLQSPRRDVSFILTVTQTADNLRLCLESVRGIAANEPVDIVVVCNVSDNADVDAALGAFRSDTRIEIIDAGDETNPTELLNIGLRSRPRNDVVIVDQMVVASSNALAGVIMSAYSGRKIGTVTPLSNHLIDNYGASAEHADLTVATNAFGRAIRQASASIQPSIPICRFGFLFIRRDCLDEVGLLDSHSFPSIYGAAEDFGMRATREGWTHKLDDRSFYHRSNSKSGGVFDDGLMSQAENTLSLRYPELDLGVSQGSARSATAIVRYRLAEANAVRRKGMPRILYVISKESGGTPQTNNDLMSRVTDEFEGYILRSEPNRILLSRYDGHHHVPCEEHRLDRPVSAVGHRSDEYDQVVASWLIDYAIQIIHVRQFGWHGVGLFEIAKELRVPVVFSFHDFYTICPTIKLLDNNLRFCGGECTDGPGTCVVELWKQDEFPVLKHRWVRSWKAIFATALETCEAFVTTSPFAKRVIQDAFPRLGQVPFHVIRHGRDFDQFRTARPLRRGERLRLLAPGNIGTTKGSKILSALHKLDRNRDLEIHVIGSVDDELAASGVIVHGPYERSRAIEQFHAIEPHVGAVLSIWPETYCHTLTELWSAGLPTIAFDAGAVGERMRRSEAGWLLPICDAEALLSVLLGIARSPTDHQAKCRKVTAWQAGEGSSYGTAAMADLYKEIYRPLARAG